MSKFNVLRQNRAALAPQMKHNKETSRRTMCCWKCQKDKQTKGSEIKMFAGGTVKFVCYDCVQARVKKEIKDE
jgi:hypothetical protein